MCGIIIIIAYVKKFLTALQEFSWRQFFWIESQFMFLLHVTPDRLMMIGSLLKNITGLLQLMDK